MRKRFCFSLATVIAVASIAMGQAPTPQTLPSLPLPATIDVAAPGPDDASGGPVGPAGPAAPEGNHFWVNADSLFWWFKDSPLPAPLLTTTSNPNLTPGALFGDPNTTVLLGSHDMNTGAHQGVRCTAGFCLDPRSQIAVEASGFYLGSRTTSRAVGSGGEPGSPVLAVPFFDADSGNENSFVLASPGAATGSAVLDLTSQLWGAEIHGAIPAFDGNNLHVEVLCGFRFLDLTEHLNYATTSIGLSDPNTGLILNTVDQFGTRNLFYGCQVGGRADYRLGNFEISASARLSFGDVLQTATLFGYTNTNFYNAPVGGPFSGVPAQPLGGAGVFVQTTNWGRTSRDQIAIVPEGDVTVSYQVIRNLRAFAGYDFLYINRVLRPGNQIDRSINFSETVQSDIVGGLAGPGSHPALTMENSGFWAQGLHLGLEFTY
jgi:Putative beta barrel porin-7 (BBP7)